MVLVFHMDVEGDGRVFPRLRHGGREPGGQRVGIDADGQARGAARAPANGGQGIGLAQRNFAGVAVQGLPGFGGRAGRGAAHQYLAHTLFQQLDAL